MGRASSNVLSKEKIMQQRTQVRIGWVSERYSQFLVAGPAGFAEILGPGRGKTGEYRASVQFKPEVGDYDQIIVDRGDRDEVLNAVCRFVSDEHPVDYGNLYFNALVAIAAVVESIEEPF
jgi:hypothetical protein